MLRFEGGKANANALQTVATAINSEPKREGDRSVVGHKRSPENVSNFENEQKRVKLEATNGDDATNGKCKAIVLNASFNFRLNQPLEDPSIIQVISGFAKTFPLASICNTNGPAFLYFGLKNVFLNMKPPYHDDGKSIMILLRFGHLPKAVKSRI
jgi:hypothetical protein